MEYNVLLNAGSLDALVRPAGQGQYLHLADLQPFTRYHIRIQACQPGTDGHDRDMGRGIGY